MFGITVINIFGYTALQTRGNKFLGFLTPLARARARVTSLSPVGMVRNRDITTRGNMETETELRGLQGNIGRASCS